jgi:hypothetical protein
VGRRRPIDRAIIGVSAIALIALCVGCGAPVLGAGIAAPASRGVEGPIVGPADGAPAGWTNLGSPWLGYTVAIPRTWAFTGHVPPADSRSPHDVFTGPIAGSDATATLVIGRCATDDPTVDDGGGGMVVDGSLFSIAEMPGEEPGRTNVIATAVRGDATWYVMGCTGDDAASRAFFRELLSTFRFPDADVMAPAVGPAGPA